MDIEEDKNFIRSSKESFVEPSCEKKPQHLVTGNFDQQLKNWKSPHLLQQQSKSKKKISQNVYSINQTTFGKIYSMVNKKVNPLVERQVLKVCTNFFIKVQTKNSMIEDEEFNLFQKHTNHLGIQNKDIPDIKQQSNDLMEYADESNPIYTNSLHQGNFEHTDSQIQDSLFYLHDEQFVQSQMNTPSQLQSQMITDNENHYQLSNLTDGKILIKRINSYNTTTKRKPFGHEEDAVIKDLIEKHGRDFKLIAQHLPGRTEQMVKNRYKSKLRKSVKSSQNLNRDFNQVYQQSSPQIQRSCELLKFQPNLNKQGLSESFSSSDIEKLHKIKLLKSDIEQIEILLHSTKSEIVKEYLAILQQKNLKMNIDNSNVA